MKRAQVSIYLFETEEDVYIDKILALQLDGLVMYVHLYPQVYQLYISL